MVSLNKVLYVWYFYFIGFSTAPKTWLPVSPDYKSNNVELQESASKSHLKVFKKLLQLRKGNVLQDGDFVEKLYNDDVYIYKRYIQFLFGFI